MCKVSIVLPIYNGEEHIGQAIESILGQSFTDFELIVVNDCSTDNTLEIVQQYAHKDKRIVVVNNEVNKRLPASLNEGFKRARGDYYTWTSDDNAYMENAIKCMHDELEAKPNVGLVYCDTRLIDAEGSVLRDNLYPEPTSLVMKNCIGACFMYRRTIAEMVGEYDVNMFLAEDYDYWMRIYQKSQIAHIGEIQYLYRIHDKSLSATRAQQVKEQTVKLWMKYFDFIMEKLENTKQKEEFFDLFYSYSQDKGRALQFLNKYWKGYVLKMKCKLKMSAIKHRLLNVKNGGK